MPSEIATNAGAPPSPLRAPVVPLRRNLILFLAVVCALVTAAVGASVLEDRQRRLDEARDKAATVARLLEEQTANMFGATDLALLGIVENLRRQPVLSDHDSVFGNSLRRLVEKLPATRALFVIGPDGFIVQDSDRDTPHRNLADRDYFRAHLEDSDAGLFIGAPLASRSVGSWFIGVSRRIEDSDGGFAGVVAAAVDVAYFESLYQQLGLAEGDIITLATTDAVLVARQPPVEDARVGRRLVQDNGESRLEQALAEGPVGSFQAVSSLDGVSRIFAYRAFREQPLVVLVGLSRERILAAWGWNALAAAAATAAALAISALLLRITLRYARREAAARAQAAEAAKFEALGRVTTGVAHDFNNLLGVFSAALRLLARRPVDEARAERIVEQGLSAVERGRTLVAQLMGVARRQDAPPSGVDINAALADLATLLETSTGPKAEIRLELAPGVSRCRLDLSRLDAAILNLVTNACDAMPEGREGRSTIRISTADCPPPAGAAAPDKANGTAGNGQGRGPAGSFVRVTVRDNGVGMAPEVRARALEPLFTTKGEGGTGIGLSRVQEFVTEAGGGIEIESTPGKGTAVHLYFPKV